MSQESRHNSRQGIELAPIAELLLPRTGGAFGAAAQPERVVEANFELTSRVLTARRDLTLRLLEVSGRAAGCRPAAKAAAKKTAKKV